MKKMLSVRPWQNAALEKFDNHDRNDFLCVATPGAGKTTFALIAARKVLAQRSTCTRLIVVVPSSHLREQWADAAASVGLILEVHQEEMTPHSHGCVTTYQSVASRPELFSSYAHNAFVIFDEIHHAGDEKTWGESLVQAFKDSPRRLSLSGTPFRSDSVAIPFVRYRNDELVIDYNYGYDEALADGGVVRPVNFHRLDGHMEWIDTDGEFNGFTFAETLDNKRNQQRLRAALAPKGKWLSHAVARAHRHLQDLRVNDPRAGGLVICTDHAHAREISSMFMKLGTTPTVVLSDDTEASQKIHNFALSENEWIIAVRMISEGVDIPRLVVGLYATSTTTELFFRQAVGRVVRLGGSITPNATMFIPNDPRLVAHASSMAEARVHSLTKKDDTDDDFSVVRELNTDLPSENSSDEQLSMFQVLSSSLIHGVEVLDTSTSVGSENSTQPYMPTIDIELPPLPSDQLFSSVSASQEISTMRKTRKHLRSQNSDCVRTIVALTGESHAYVNSTLNKHAEIKSIASATTVQLDKRLKHAREWIARSVKKRVS